MKKIQAPNINCFDEFEKIRKSKRKPICDRLRILQPIIAQRYIEYDAYFASNSLHSLTTKTYSDEAVNDLLICYTSKTEALYQLKTAIKKNKFDEGSFKCSYCDLNEDYTFDHYLPKSIFPEFSVKALNLIPCCSRCNELKQNYWLDSTTQNRGIINVYIDSMPKVQYLFVELVYDQSKNLFTANLSLKNVNGIDPALFSMIELHFAKLELAKRYSSMFGEVFGQVVSIVTTYWTNQLSPKLIKTALEQYSDSQKQQRGQNFYEAIIYDALANNSDFLDNLSRFIT